MTTLKKRAEYLRVRKGARCATPAFVLEAKARSDEDRAPPTGTPRFGFTVTKQVGKAVERNRIRRRLKAAVRDVAPDHAKRDFDYVLIARRPALDVGVCCARERARQGVRARAPRAGAGAVSRRRG